MAHQMRGVVGIIEHELKMQFESLAWNTNSMRQASRQFSCFFQKIFLSNIVHQCHKATIYHCQDRLMGLLICTYDKKWHYWRLGINFYFFTQIVHHQIEFQLLICTYDNKWHYWRLGMNFYFYTQIVHHQIEFQYKIHLL